MIDSHSVAAKLLHLPLRLLKPGKSLPILSGRLRGTKWIVDAGDRGCWLGTYQREKQDLFCKNISPGNIVFDLGGNLGFFSLLASKLVGPSGKVFVFEHQPHNLDSLRKHLELNKSQNVTLIEEAVSYKNASISVEHISSDNQPPSKTCTLDGLLENGQIPLPDFIHMDLGNSAFAALCGAKSLLSKAHPTIILTTQSESSRRESCAFLEMLDYRLETVEGNPLENTGAIIATHF